jgi:hypothetical protein
MSLLAPLFLLGFGAIAVPILVHLIQRERKHVIQFPSLMFVQRIPYQSVRRRRLRHWFLLLMRAAAIALIVLAFARPYFPQGAAAAIAAVGGSREVVLLLDQSASMGYGDHWQRAKDAAAGVVGDLGVSDRATLVLFSRNAEENVRSTSDRGRLEGALNTAVVTSGATRYSPALKLAESILSQSTLQRKEAVLISDFQKTGWSGSEDVHFGEGITLTPISVASEGVSNVSVPSVAFSRAAFSNQERVTVTAGVSNKGADDVKGLQVSLEIDGHPIESKPVDIAANAAASVAFAPFTLANPGVQGVVRAGTDGFPSDNSFDFIVNPSQAVSVLVVNNSQDAQPSFYLSKALSIGSTPAFDVEVVPASRATAAMLDRHAVVVLNDTAVPPQLTGGVLKRFVEGGGGLLVVFGEHSTWPSTEADLLPGTLGEMVDRTESRGATIGFRDYSHPVFEVFKAPRSGDFSAARVWRYRTLAPAPDSRVIARFDDGAVAAAERRVGNGRVIAWATTLDDSWTDLALKPVFLPLVHQINRYLGQYEEQSAWSIVGQVVDLDKLLKAKADRVIVTPSNERIRRAADESAPLELTEHGVYEIRAANEASGRPDRIAVNLDPAESDLTALDPSELVAAVTGRAATTSAAPAGTSVEVTPEDAEKQQGLWWYLLLGGLLLLAAETAVANRLSRNERFS